MGWREVGIATQHGRGLPSPQCHDGSVILSLHRQAGRKGVPQIMKAKWLKTSFLHGPFKDTPHSARSKGKEPVIRRWLALKFQLREEVLHDRVHWHAMRLSSLRPRDSENPGLPVNIYPSQAKKFTLPEPGIEGHHDKTIVFGEECSEERFFLSVSQVADDLIVISG